ncbi:PTS sugar transporter subunit IIC [Gleimia hominis]|uniref:PTS sugar transporter subunit IIC n=1 Tax=Gleimia hominis TaxID=595468 RepID=UPI002542E006|nr:PTS sugar transporter subunit IIC [Gleimia hominis]WIK63924.1 PTS sugar transporter subunit IIC [Gleimia hominis]
MKSQIRSWLSLFFIDAMTGMAHGLFATLILGTILIQVGGLIPGSVGHFFIMVGSIASLLTGAGIGLGVANRLGASTYVVAGTALAGMIGAHASKFFPEALWTACRCNCKARGSRWVPSSPRS